MWNLWHIFYMKTKILAIFQICISVPFEKWIQPFYIYEVKYLSDKRLGLQPQIFTKSFFYYYPALPARLTAQKLRIWSYLLKKSLMENFSFLRSDKLKFCRIVLHKGFGSKCEILRFRFLISLYHFELKKMFPDLKVTYTKVTLKVTYG